MKTRLFYIAFILLISAVVNAQSLCSPQGDQVTYGTGNTWNAYVYDDVNFTNYYGYVTEGNAGSPNFDESFGGDYVNYATNGCPVYTETFSVRYKLRKSFTPGNYEFIAGADDGYRLSLDGGSTWIINHWADQSYNSTTYDISLNGSYDMVLEYYENSGGNRVSFSVQPVCVGIENQSVTGSGNIWNGYIYYGMNFNTYKGMTHEGAAANPAFDESFGGANVSYSTSGCPVQTENFSARYRLQKSFTAGTYVFTVGGDDGYRLSLDGGSTWVINRWYDQSYNLTTYSTYLTAGTYNLVIEFYENSGDNRISFSYSTGVLPVRLQKFEGKLIPAGVQLNWLVSEEINSDYYAIERSSNGIDFTRIKTITATGQAGSSGTDINYQYIDPSPLNGINYYRLRMVDKDGSYTYSSVILLTTVSKSLVDFFPAITAGEPIKIRANANLKNAKVSLYDLTGKEIQQIKLPGNMTAGQTITLSLITNRLPPSTYLLVCESATELFKKQLIVVQ